jgi:hypothetical protein
MKAHLLKALRADNRFSDTQSERRWRGNLTGSWRRPDVSAVYNGIRIAFEIQLSTTFLDVVVARREFYLNEGGLLIWVFATFDDGDRKLLQDDVFYNNNRNAFILNDNAVAASVASGGRKFECVWDDPRAKKQSRLQRQLVEFADLTLDLPAQRAFFFDHDAAQKAITNSAISTAQTARNAFEEWWLSAPNGYNLWANSAHYIEVRDAATLAGYRLPEDMTCLPMHLLNILYSAKHGRPIGWGFQTFIEVAHRVEGGHKKYLLWFRSALLAFNRSDQIKREDKSRKWRDKVARYRQSLLDGDPAYEPDVSDTDLIYFLFPEVARALNALDT